MSGAVTRHLAVSVHLYEGRYHGTGEWRPSPGRLFQALVAAEGSQRAEDSERALLWLEALTPPQVGLPAMRSGQRVQTYVPNNDADSLGGDLRRIEDIRAAKWIEPKLFDADIPLLFIWSYQDDELASVSAPRICAIADRLYQFGRGVDMAWASAMVLDDAELAARLRAYSGSVLRPTPGGRGRLLPCPEPGSLRSLDARHAANSQRFRNEGGKQLFSQPPKPRFSQVAYESLPSRRVYELRSTDASGSFAPWKVSRASVLVTWLRDGAMARLRGAYPERADLEPALVGRRNDGAPSVLASQRVRILPLPSTGHAYADFGIRRVLVEVPADCPIAAEDVHWAFAGLPIANPETGEVLDSVLTAATDDSMADRYGVPRGANRREQRVWRSATAVALPEQGRRRRIEPSELPRSGKGGEERAGEEARARFCVAQAVRHADLRAGLKTVRVRREPFDARSERAEAFAAGTRFAKERLWHVEVEFDVPIAGPLALGDGRFLGLGVMRPVPLDVGAYAFDIDAGTPLPPDPMELTHALRRAVMARAQDVLGARPLPAFFSGHQKDGSPAGTAHPHLTFAFDPERRRLLVMAPHVVENRVAEGEERFFLPTLEAALSDLTELRVRGAGRLRLRASTVDRETDPIFAASRDWETVTPYQVTRHSKARDAFTALTEDVLREVVRRKLPAPTIVPKSAMGVARVGLTGHVAVTFPVPVTGPLLLGRSRFQGGGLLAPRPKCAATGDAVR